MVNSVRSMPPVYSRAPLIMDVRRVGHTSGIPVPSGTGYCRYCLRLISLVYLDTSSYLLIPVHTSRNTSLYLFIPLTRLPAWWLIRADIQVGHRCAFQRILSGSGTIFFHKVVDGRYQLIFRFTKEVYLLIKRYRCNIFV